ncbi:MAG: TIGR03560 family F420-dependent LLM class oxidoreductase [Candidatus Thorarchaeota archaeon]|nr:MAG: TIGR03560 family F420-dependent LLM class oxidoreductase [Candidatus Thorarchaeota archaeon]
MKVKFGVHIEPQLGYTYSQALAIAKEAERLGYESFWCSDHLFLNQNSAEQNCLEAWTLLAALAAETETIRLGTTVTCNSYRHPSLLAKIAASVDMISNGRLWFGYGAGWKKIEYKAYGYDFPKVQVRMDMMEEALEIIKLLWTEPSPTYKGKHYSIENAFSAPKPIQKPHPPILIGGDGEKRTLKAVAKYADYCNLFVTPKLERKLDVLKEHCADIGRDYDSVGKSLFAQGWPGVFVSTDEEELELHWTRRSEILGTPREKAIENANAHAPGSWVGYPEELTERFEYLIGLGFDFFQVVFMGLSQDYIDSSKAFSELVMKRI